MRQSSRRKKRDHSNRPFCLQTVQTSPKKGSPSYYSNHSTSNCRGVNMSTTIEMKPKEVKPEEVKPEKIAARDAV